MTIEVAERVKECLRFVQYDPKLERYVPRSPGALSEQLVADLNLCNWDAIASIPPIQHTNRTIKIVSRNGVSDEQMQQLRAKWNAGPDTIKWIAKCAENVLGYNFIAAAISGGEPDHDD